MDRTDERHFTWAMDQAGRYEKRETRSTWIGGTVAVFGILATVYLTVSGHELIAAIIGASLVSLLGVVVGKRLQS
jgi:uncharacterized membrane protein YjjB (DUF3815 family)